jgi:two-component sensor histidine kinase
MRDEDKTKEQLLDEIQRMRQRIIMLEVIEKEHRLTAKQLKQRIEIEEALAWASSLIVSSDEPDLNEILKIFGEAVHANRSYIFLIRDNGRKADNTHEWCNPSTEPQIHNLQGLDSSQFPWWMEKLEHRENIVIPDVSALPPEAAAEKEIIQSQGVRSLLVVPIDSKERKLLGFMGFDDTERCRTWSEEDIRLLRVASEMIARYFWRKQAEDQLKVSFREKEILLRELYHRTKNNMQIISSLLNLQSMAIDDKQMLHVIQEIQNRIRSLSLVHEKLFEARDLSNISLKDYIEDLAQALLASYQGSNKRISVTVNVENVFLSLDSITICGLIINELVSNSLKYAFPDEKAGHIRIVLQSTVKGEMELRISDNGAGLPEGLDFEDPKTLGLKLVRGLAEDQLRGKVELTGEKRSDFLITFKEITGHTKNIGSWERKRF